MDREEPLAGSQRFRKLKTLNAGTFGFVQLAANLQTGEKVAIKFLPRGPCVNKAVMREVLNHRMLAKHPHVVRFMEVILTPYHLGICMEYCPGGDLFEYLASHQSPLQCVGLPEDVARRFFQQLITAVDFTHELGIANRDIKLENTLLTASCPIPRVKLCDFGYSKNEFWDSPPRSVSGTPDYIAPEVLQNEHYDGKKADIWSADARDNQKNNVIRLQQMMPRIVRADFEQPAHVSALGRHLLNRMLNADPADRIDVMGVCPLRQSHRVQQHQWFQINLPEELRELNFHLIQKPFPSGLQSIDDIERIIQQATRVDTAYTDPKLCPWDAV